MARDPYVSTDLAELLVRKHFPERTDMESAIILDFIRARGAEYAKWQFSVRVGEGVELGDAVAASARAQARFNSKKRIDMIAWQGDQPTLIEVKQRIGPGVLGQLRTYARLYLWEFPQVRTVRLAAVGRYSDSDTLAVLRTEGVDVYLYPVSDDARSPAVVG